MAMLQEVVLEKKGKRVASAALLRREETARTFAGAHDFFRLLHAVRNDFIP